jgi:hypothetical protein
MPLAQKGSARRAEAHLAAKREQTAVGFVLIDEGLKGRVDDLDLASHSCQAPSARDEIVTKVDHRSSHDIEVPEFDIVSKASRPSSVCSAHYTRSNTPRAGTPVARATASA